MHKSSAEDFLSCGIDVSAAQLVVALEVEGRRYGQRSFPNRASAHQPLIAWLKKTGAGVRVCLEATGLYSLDVALALHAEYARRMPFQLWQPPRAAALELRAVTRHLAALTQQHTRESNRLHAASASTADARCVCSKISNVLGVISSTASKSCARRL